MSAPAEIKVLTMDKVQSKFKKTSRGFIYHYLFAEAHPGKPTILFVHGFPSTSHGWYHQIDYFQPKGYGLIVPDILGHGKTEPKSLNPADFLHTAVAQDIVDVVDGEGTKDVIAVGHDWGCVILSMLSVKHSNRFLGFAFTAVSYYAPSILPPLDVILEFQKQTYGRPILGYWSFVAVRDDAARVIEDGIDSFLDIFYPADHEIWKTYMNLPGEMEWFIRNKRRLRTAPYVTPEHYEQIKASLLQGGLNSPLIWYRSNVLGLNNGIRASVTEEDVKIKKPAFMLLAKYEHVCFPEFAISEMRKYAKGGLTLVELDVGHWPHLERPQEYNDALHRWVASTSKLEQA